MVLDPGQVRAEWRDRGDVSVTEPESLAQVLVDVRVDREDRTPELGEMADEQSRQRGLAAATLADEGDTHSGRSLPYGDGQVERKR